MYHLRLIKGKSYWGIVKASEDKPDVYVPEKEQAERLVSSGYFELVEGPDEKTNTESETDFDGEYEDTFADDEDVEESHEESEESSVIVELQKKTKDELIEYAKLKGIDLTGCSKKDEVFQKIVQELARADEARAAIRSEE